VAVLACPFKMAARRLSRTSTSLRPLAEWTRKSVRLAECAGDAVAADLADSLASYRHASMLANASARRGLPGEGSRCHHDVKEWTGRTLWVKT
jgi:hypothetical protein